MKKIERYIYNNYHILYNDNYYKGGEKKIMKKMDIPMMIFAFIGLFFFWINYVIFMFFFVVYNTYWWCRVYGSDD